MLGSGILRSEGPSHPPHYGGSSGNNNANIKNNSHIVGVGGGMSHDMPVLSSSGGVMSTNGINMMMLGTTQTTISTTGNNNHYHTTTMNLPNTTGHAHSSHAHPGNSTTTSTSYHSNPNISGGQGESSTSTSGGGGGSSLFCLIPCDEDTSSSSPPWTPNVLLIFGLPWYAKEREVDAYLRRVYPMVAPKTTRLYTFPHNGMSRGICFVEYPKKGEAGWRSGGVGWGGGGGSTTGFPLSTTMKESHSYNNSNSSSSVRGVAGRRRQRRRGGGGGAIPGNAGTSPHSAEAYGATCSSSSSNAAGSSPAGGGGGGGTGSSVEEDEGGVEWFVIPHRILANPWEGSIPLFARCYYLPLSASLASHWDRSGVLPPLPMDPPQSKSLVGYGEEGRRVRCGATLEIPNTCSSMEAYSKVELCRKRLRRVIAESNHNMNTKTRSTPVATSTSE